MRPKSPWIVRTQILVTAGLLIIVSCKLRLPWQPKLDDTGEATVGEAARIWPLKSDTLMLRQLDDIGVLSKIAPSLGFLDLGRGEVIEVKGAAGLLIHIPIGEEGELLLMFDERDKLEKATVLERSARDSYMDRGLFNGPMVIRHPFTGERVAKVYFENGVVKDIEGDGSSVLRGRGARVPTFRFRESNEETSPAKNRNNIIAA